MASIQDIKYCEYFNVDEAYFPCIDESAINAGEKWETTYPHETFIELLKNVEKMLGGSTNRSVWIHGAYGTGKSKCAYALKKILEVPEAELRAYWNSFDTLRKNTALLEKIIGYKESGIITPYRYASGTISTPQMLFLSIQESIKASLEKNNIGYKGENTLKESVISWLESPIHATMVNSLLQQPEWMSTFSQSSADEIINSLRKSDDVSGLMENIFKMAAKEGIVALTLNADNLRSWILDIIEQNHIKIVFIWDEFSDFFRQNKNSLGEFQKIVSICQEAPFYFIVVTHPITSLSSSDDSWKVVQQRFDKTEIKLPDNIAFDLTANAFSVKDSAKSNWNQMTSDLEASVTSSTAAIRKSANITNPDVMKNILPLHPVTALVLKNIAEAFQSNQRSMFDFIKSPKDTEVRAFQWFIQNTSPTDERPLLTVDMLWDFFYEKGKDYLSSDIKLILDTFSQQTMLNDKEKIVLKTILIMQAIDQRLGGTVAVLKPTDQNLSYAFEGDVGELESNCKNIAKALVDKGVLIHTPIADNKKMYSAAVLAGDSAKIEGYKKEIRNNSTTLKLVSDGAAIACALSLPPALKLRYATNADTGSIPVVTSADFTKTMDALKNKDVNWHFYAVMAVAKTEDEAQAFRKTIKNTIANDIYKNIIIIDALSTPLGVEAFEQYIDYSAMSQYYNGNNNQQSKENAKKAKDVLERDWKDRIHDGQFIVYTYANQDGEKATGANAIHTILQTHVLNRYRRIFDFTKGLSETQLKLTTAKPVSRYGMGGTEIKGLISGCEKSVLGKVWNRSEYWNVPEFENDSIVVIKKAIDKMISDAFIASGKISFDEIYDYLEDNYGFSPCNLSAFVTGFLLKEYSSDPYRYMDSEGKRDSMTPDKLSEMIGNYIGKNPKPTYIVSLTPEEKAFYEITEEAWSITPNTCSSPSHAVTLILAKMRELSYPIWCLEDVDTIGVYDVLKKYIALVQSKGDEAHTIANEIGSIAMQRPSAAQGLKKLITKDNCQKGMALFLEHFDNRALIKLADEIGAGASLLSDIKKLFSVKYSALWIGSTGEDEIRKLTTEYNVIKTTNILLNSSEHSIDAAFKAWREKLKFLGFSCELARKKMSALDNLFGHLLKIANFEDILPDAMSDFYNELTSHSTDINDILNNSVGVFSELYSPYLAELSALEIEEIKNSIKTDMFTASATASNASVTKAADDYRKNQVKTQLFKLWNEKTNGTKTPKDWSTKNRTPILCCIEEDIYEDAKKAFATLNSWSASESEIKSALAFIQNATFFDDIANADFRNKKFMSKIVGRYSVLLSDISAVRDTLEKLAVDVYEWSDSPLVKSKIRNMADAVYNAGGSDEAINIIDTMSDAELKNRLKELTRNDSELGMKILISGRS